MRLAAALIIGGLLLTGCGGSKNAPTPAAPTTTVAAVGGVVVTITELKPAGANVYVGYEATNPTKTEQRFEYDKLTITGPDGTPHTPYRDPGTATYELVSPGNRYIDGGYVQYPTFTPGRYTVAYDGKMLAGKTL